MNMKFLAGGNTPTNSLSGLIQLEDVMGREAHTSEHYMLCQAQC